MAVPRQVIDRQASEPAISFPAWLQDVYEQRFTGAVHLHFFNGRPHIIEIPAAPTRIVLDKRGS